MLFINVLPTNDGYKIPGPVINKLNDFCKFSSGFTQPLIAGIIERDTIKDTLISIPFLLQPNIFMQRRIFRRGIHSYVQSFLFFNLNKK
jgi:hypothetical protein